MVLVAIGKKGSGKSSLLRRLISVLLASETPPLFLVHDPNGNYNVPAAHTFGSAAAWRRAKTIPALSVFRGVEDPDELGELALQVRDCTLVFDELDRCFRNKQWAAPSVQRIVNEGRNYRVSLWGGFRRTAAVNEDILNACDAAYLFRQSKASLFDLRGLAQRIGPEYAQTLPGLEWGEFVVWRDE